MATKLIKSTLMPLGQPGSVRQVEKLCKQGNDYIHLGCRYAETFPLVVSRPTNETQVTLLTIVYVCRHNYKSAMAVLRVKL